MFRVARLLPLTVVAPVPWFPLQGLLRKWKPHFRPPAPALEMQEGIAVRRPRFLSVPSAFKWLDGFCIAAGCFPTLLRLKRDFGCNLIDAHFAYPEGYAATLLGRWLRIPVCITLRGTEVPLARDPRRRRRMIKAMQNATRVFAVSDSLKRHAMSLGIAGDKILVVGNGVDTVKFHRLDRRAAREKLGLATRNEGWANVFLEAMACGLPVVTTEVGGNAEVVAHATLGILVPFEQPERLTHAIADALVREWNRDAIVAYAESNSWERRVRTLAEE